ncbi:hypothetical protein ACFL35_06645 [Candidatus Riflebacteria bacterium]
MHQGKVLDLDLNISLVGARLSIEYKIPMADSLMLEFARVNNSVFWTQDPDFENIENVRYINKIFNRV